MTGDEAALPPGWIEGKLAEFVQPRGEKLSPSEMPEAIFLGMDHVEAHTTRIVGGTLASKMKSAAARFYAGDVLYGRLRPYLNKVAGPSFDGLASAEFIVFPETELVHSRFLKHRLNAADFVSFASHLNEGDRPRVGFDQIGAFDMQLPPPNEQCRIVAMIEELFSELAKGVEALTTAREQLKAYRQSVLKGAFEGKLTQRWRTDKTKSLIPGRISEIPNDLAAHCAECWPWRRLGDISKVTGGLTKNPKRTALPKTMKYLRVANVYADRLELADVAEIGVTEVEFESVKLQRGDLLIVEGNGSVEQIGRVALWNGELQDVGHQNHLIRVRLLPGMSPRFVLSFLVSPLGRDLIVRQASSTSGLHTLSISKVAGLPVPVPTIEEQQALIAAIAAALSEIEGFGEEIEAGLARCAALRQSILKQAFAGQLVAQDPKDEPASALLERIRAEKELTKGQKKNGRKKKNEKEAA